MSFFISIASVGLLAVLNYHAPFTDNANIGVISEASAPFIRAQLAPANPLNAEQMRKITYLLDRVGKDETLIPAITESFGFKGYGAVRHYSRGTAKNYVYSFNKIRNSSDIVLTLEAPGGTNFVCLLDVNFNVKDTVRISREGTRSKIDDTNLARVLELMMEFWANVAAETTSPTLRQLEQ